MKRPLALSLLLLLACNRESAGGKLEGVAGKGGAPVAGGSSVGGQGGSADALGAAAAANGGEWVDTLDASGCEQPAVTKNCQDGWCSIPPGCFVMGSPENEWDHAPQEKRAKTRLTRGFLIQQTEVTQGQWTGAGLANPSGVEPNGGAVGQGECKDNDCPVGDVNWWEAVSYANLLSEEAGLEPCYVLLGCKGTIGVGTAGLYCESFELTAKTIYECAGYRLPTGAEWEYAARAGSKAAFYDGDISTQHDVRVCADEPALDTIAWYCQNSGLLAHPVAGLAPNDWGLYDVLGNVTEWSNDQAGWSASSDTLTDPDQTFGPGVSRETRGGFRGDSPPNCRVANRIGISDYLKVHGLGFRLVRRAP